MHELPRLNPQEELVNMKKIYGKDNYPALYGRVYDTFNVLQARSQMLVGLITICLTISGFSGPQIAGAGLLPKVSLCFGLSMVLLSGFILLGGPLQLRWGTRTRSESLDDSLVLLLKRRNQRTIRYHIASIILIIGLTGYIGSLILYMLKL